MWLLLSCLGFNHRCIFFNVSTTEIKFDIEVWEALQPTSLGSQPLCCKRYKKDRIREQYLVPFLSWHWDASLLVSHLDPLPKGLVIKRFLVTGEILLCCCQATLPRDCWRKQQAYLLVKAALDVWGPSASQRCRRWGSMWNMRVSHVWNNVLAWRLHF